MNIRNKLISMVRRRNAKKTGEKEKSIPSEREQEIIQQKMTMLNAASRHISAK